MKKYLQLWPLFLFVVALILLYPTQQRHVKAQTAVIELPCPQTPVPTSPMNWVGTTVDQNNNGALKQWACVDANGTVYLQGQSTGGGGVTPLPNGGGSTNPTTAFFTPPVPSNSFFGGPCANCVGGTYDGQSDTSTGSSLVGSVTETFQPTLSNQELLFFVAQGDPARGPVFTVPSGFTADFGLNTSHLLLTSKNVVSATTTLGPTSTVAAGMFALNTTNGNPIRVANQNIISGNFGNGPINFSPTTTPTAGNAALIFIHAQLSTFTTFTANVIDSNGDIFTPVMFIQNNQGARNVIEVFASLFIKGGATTYTIYWTGGGAPAGLNGSIDYSEWSGLGPISPQASFLPAFRNVFPPDLPGGTANGTVVARITHNLSSNVAVAASTVTTIDSVSFPFLTGVCGLNQCRARVTWTYYVSGGLDGAIWVDDGTNQWGFGSFGIPTNNFSISTSSGVYSTSQYSANATPTFTLKAENAGAVTVCTAYTNVAPCNTGSFVTNFPPATVLGQMQVEIILSN